ncbi:hypothetical protein [Pseudomonas sp. AN-1]|uniref:hypothetical protein n=1 Tax=Pseudomonas sp. AN-1 TaxID=3096605 RepID=UPI002A6A5D3B|nr:hypothetical protein [Pseudomonas sp. AN-1]WPP44237.1 hypothetical protein SK095_13260 [Pseudomonas sp. AN-1]
MSKLFELIEAAVRQIPAQQPPPLPPPEELRALTAANDSQRAVQAALPATQPTSESRHNAWTVTLHGKLICRMVGQPMTRSEALATARWRWPEADILED